MNPAAQAMITFCNLKPECAYDIIDSETGHPLSLGAQGAEAMRLDWPEDAEAWPAGETKFRGSPVEVAS